MNTHRERRFSLEQKLPVLIGGLVAVLLITFLALVSRELQHNALSATDDRLKRITAQITRIVATGAQARTAQLDTMAGNDALRAYLLGTTTLEDSTRRVLTPRGTVAAIRLRTADGRVLLHNPDPIPTALVPERNRPDYTSTGGRPTETGPFHRLGDRTAYWLTRRVDREGAVIGYIDQLRIVQTGAGELESLIGDQVRLYFGGRTGPWLTLSGGLIDVAPPLSGPQEMVQRTGVEGEPVYAIADSIPASDWTVIAEIPVVATTARPLAVLRRLVIIGLVLLILGGVAAWLVSRSVTRPLRQLAAIADAIRAGDYSRRARLERDDEIGRLAGSFDTMLQHIEASHDELGRRYTHAQALAVELEQANQRLQSAIHDANAARTEAQQANRAKDEFLATMSHELRTPINAMIGYTDLLDVGVAGPMQPRQHEFIERIRVSGHHLIAIVNDVLDFAKIESGQLRLEREERPATASINSAAAMLEARARARNISISVDCPSNTAFVGDGRRVQQILLNLLSNAVKFTEPGGRITIRCQRRQSQPVRTSKDAGSAAVWTCITVSDTGVGIAPDQQHAIFEPFVQGTGGYTRPHGGTGLGLAISRSLAHMMGGDLTVESQPGAGASFTLWLPHPSSATVPQSA